MELINEFKEERQCVYKDETYSVRDNGAVLRHAKNESRSRKLDNVWTFGEKNEKTGYMTVGTARVHIIVATAFHGENDSKKLVVDHIDTNRCNNRVENLRWITRLENVLKNPVTRKKVDFLCGGIENFIKDPSCLRDVAGTNQDVSWMRTVSAEEAKNAYENVMRWAKYEKPVQEASEVVDEGRTPRTKDPEWMFKRQDFDPFNPVVEVPSYYRERRCPQSYGNFPESYSSSPYVQAKYPEIAVQLNWRTPTEFLCCPEQLTDDVIAVYLERLTEGVIFCRNDFWTSKVVKAALYDEGKGLAVWTVPVSDGLKSAIAKVYVQDGKIVHETEGTYFTSVGAEKAFTILQGLEWTGGDSIDDYC